MKRWEEASVFARNKKNNVIYDTHEKNSLYSYQFQLKSLRFSYTMGSISMYIICNFW